MRIIVVDDEFQALGTFLKEVMYEGDVEYRFFGDNEAEIISYLNKCEVDAAFLDIRMPSIDGVVLAKKIIASHPKIRIVFITGLSTALPDLPESLRPHVEGFIYKPYAKEDIQKIFNSLKRNHLYLEAFTFETFECFVNGRIVEFSSAKSKELFAILVVYGGKTLTMADAINKLYPGKDIGKAKILYRDAIWRLRKTLDGLGMDLVEFHRGETILKKERIRCDYWDYLADKNEAYNGHFLDNYPWSKPYLVYLDKIADKRKSK